MKLELTKITAAVSGKLLPAGAHGQIDGISTDSRSVQAGQLFVALRGANFDGHDFLATAAEKGAAAVLCDHLWTGATIPQVVVTDTLRALGALAAHWRRQFALPVVAVTGSSGKTTTKEMLATILGQERNGLKTEGNFNNLIGLPLTLLRLHGEHAWAVLELGMSERGEIARLTELAMPQIGIITNVAAAHLATLKSLDGVARAKGELFAGLQPGSTAIVNSDDERVAALPVANGVRRLRYGCGATAEVRAAHLAADGIGYRFELLTPQGTCTVRLGVAGRHNVHNALAAAAAALVLGTPLPTIRAGLERFRPSRGRMDAQRLTQDILLLEDAYNANPLSMRAALVALDEIGGSGQRLAVLADMLELGDEAAELHREVGRSAVGRVDTLILFGPQAQHIGAGAQEAGFAAEQIVHCTSREAALNELLRRLHPGDRVVVKGSRGMQMDLLAAGLRQHYPVLAPEE